MAGREAVIEIREISALSALEEAMRLQQRVWGYADLEALPLSWFVITRETGGQVLAAYSAGEMIGFCAAIAAIGKDGRPYLHSHMLAVLERFRNAGVGRALKLRQRDDALARGIDRIEWTFDPLELKNGYFNLVRLGAIARRYSENHYGLTASPLHGGLPTDRLVAEWRLCEKGSNRHAEVAARIAYPAGIARIRSEEPERAREIQRANAALFRDAFARGLAVTGFERTEREGVYLLGHCG
jgi:predicted GNAT superfamily acetyltransferase